MAPVARRPGSGLVVAMLVALGVLLGLPVGAPGVAPAVLAAEPRAIDQPEPPAAPPALAPPSGPAAAPVVMWHGPRTERVVALTFDDGWNPGVLRRIYRELVREHVPATFFVTGEYISRDPALWRQIARAGFPLANHSYLHRDTRRLTPGQAAADLALTRRAVERATGITMLPAFRPPYGARTAATDREAAAAGFPYVVLWDVTGGDTGHRPSVATVVRGATAGRAGSVILLHAGPRVTPRALAAIIARYRARGFQFVGLPELLHIPFSGPGGADAMAPIRASDDATRALDPAVDEPAAAARSSAGGIAVPTSSVPAAPALVAVAAPAAATAAPPPARDAAWARREDTPLTVAVATVVLLGLVLAAAAFAGRRPPEDDPAG
jgi:peptidoglycan/xylan/chitin deacetylase (PgdA/CDA1 family)